MSRNRSDESSTLRQTAGVWGIDPYGAGFGGCGARAPGAGLALSEANRWAGSA